MNVKMTKQVPTGLMGILVTVVGTAALWCGSDGAAADPPPAQPAVVEGDMHEFMEYVFEPPYKRLKASLSTSTADRNAWKGIKSDALILAEAANLLLHRAPAERAEDWRNHAIAVRQQGSELYKAAKGRDLDLTRKQFAAQLTRCNRCHDDFAEGKHQLAP